MNKIEQIVKETLNIKSAIQLKTDGELTEVAPNEKEVTLKELYDLCSCDLVECVYLPNNKIMIVDEEGKLKEKPEINLLATMIASHCYKNFMVICGDVVIVNNEQFR